ncbi:MAG: YhgE/Pip domain-containing protein [Bacillota bacterium]|nr:YhgE/Pip domain-containing protein [Bacillota bacterium]
MDVRNILKVYKRDMLAIIKNPIALLIIGGLCIIPSLYAWVNIKACWNPYNNTSDIPVAIVNNDKGTTIKGKKLNIGNDVVKKLKTNHSIGWRFVGSKEANLGVVDGTYFAVIEIPEDFSSSFTSVLTGNFKRPEIIYKVDTKNNPVAGKITEAAESSLVNQITSNFISTVNETIFSSLNGVGQDAEKNKKKLINLKDDIIAVDKNMDLITGLLQGVQGRSENLSEFLTEMSATMPSVSNGLSSIEKSNENTKNLLSTTEQTLNTSLEGIQIGLNNAQTSAFRMQNLINNLNLSMSNNSASQVNSNIASINLEINSLQNEISSITDYLVKINNFNPNGDVCNLIASLKSAQSSLTDEKAKLNNLQQQYAKTNKISQDLLNSINTNNSNLNTQLLNTTKQYNTKAKPALNTIANSLINAANDTSSLLQSAQGLVQQINQLMKTALDGSNLANDVSSDLNNRLLQFRDVISALSAKLQQVDNDNLIQIISILQSDPKFMGDFIASPFDIKQEGIYSIPNYGSGMAPVYTVLALWVGCLLLTSLLKTEAAYFEGIEALSVREKFFGKMLTFVTLALIQGFIASVGDKLLLGVYTSNAVLMVLFALLSSMTFAIITYTLVALLGNLGKALAIVFMIVQLAGSGGTYPIQVDPLIFRILQPLFPFTYSIGGFREAIAGPLMGSVALDFVMLLIMSIIFILIGFFFRKRLYALVSGFEAKFKESGIGE